MRDDSDLIDHMPRFYAHADATCLLLAKHDVRGTLYASLRPECRLAALGRPAESCKRHVSRYHAAAEPPTNPWAFQDRGPERSRDAAPPTCEV